LSIVFYLRGNLYGEFFYSKEEMAPGSTKKNTQSLLTVPIEKY